MSTIPANSIVTVVVGDAQTVAGISNALNASDVLAAVSTYLNGLGNYQVETTSESGGVLSTISPLIQETFQATLNIQVFSSEDTSQLAADVAAAFEAVTNQTPSQITIPNVGGQPTGQAAPTPTVNQSVTGGISSFFSSVTGGTTSLLIGLAAIIIIVVVLIAWGPNVGKIAGAVA